MNGLPPRRPRNAAAWTRLDPARLSEHLLAGGERLADTGRVRFLRGWQSAVAFPFEVTGDSGNVYEVWVEPQRQDGVWAHCSRGGDHDRLPAHAVCKHMVAAVLDLVHTVRPDLGDQFTKEPA